MSFAVILYFPNQKIYNKIYKYIQNQFVLSLKKKHIDLIAKIDRPIVY